MDKIIKSYLRSSKIYYMSHFGQAWIGFNSWYNQNESGSSEWFRIKTAVNSLPMRAYFMTSLLTLKVLLLLSISITGCASYTERGKGDLGASLTEKTMPHDSALTAEPSSARKPLKKQCVFRRRIVYDSKWAYINKSGDMVIDVVYKDIGDFHEGMAYAKVDDKFGYIDKKGDLVIKPQFDYVRDFSNGLASVMINGKWGFIDQKGEYTIKLVFDYASSFGDGLAPVKIGDKFGYLCLDGQVKIKPTFDCASSFSEGRALVFYGEVTPIKEGEGFGFVLSNVERRIIDTSGKIIKHDEFEISHPAYSEGLLAVSHDGLWGYMDRDGRITIDTKYDSALPFADGFGIVRKNDTLFFINRDGDVLQSMDYGIDREREVSFYYRDGCIVPFSELHGNYLKSHGYMDIRSGETIVEPTFSDTYRFSEGLARVRTAMATNSTRVTPYINSSFKDEYGLMACQKDGYWGYCRDLLGKKVVIKPRFEAVYSFFDGYAAVMHGGKWGFIDKQGRFAIAPTYDWAYPFSYGFAAVKVGEKWGFIDRLGQLIIKPMYGASQSW